MSFFPLKLTDDSCRFVDQALHIFKSMAESIKYFSDEAKQKEAFSQLIGNISPLTDQAFQPPPQPGPALSKRNLYDTFVTALYDTLRKTASAEAAFDTETAFAWKVFFLDCVAHGGDGFSALKDAQADSASSSGKQRPETASSGRGSAKKIAAAAAASGGASASVTSSVGVVNAGGASVATLAGGEKKSKNESSSVKTESEGKAIGDNKSQLAGSSAVVGDFMMSEERAEYWRNQ